MSTNMTYQEARDLADKGKAVSIGVIYPYERFVTFTDIFPPDYNGDAPVIRVKLYGNPIADIMPDDTIVVFPTRKYRDNVPPEWVTPSTRAGLMAILAGYVSCRTPGSKGGPDGPWTIEYSPGFNRGPSGFLVPGMEIKP